MSIKRILLSFVAAFIVITPSFGGDIISCDSFENCPDGSVPPTNAILDLQARVEALEALLEGATRELDPSTSQDTLTFDNANSSEAVVIRELSTTEGRADFPVCFNGEGELLPCTSIDPPPVDDPYIGSWTGRMVYSRTSSGACHDASVNLNVARYSTDEIIESVTVISDTGGLGVWSDAPVFSPKLTANPQGEPDNLRGKIVLVWAL